MSCERRVPWEEIEALAAELEAVLTHVAVAHADRDAGTLADGARQIRRAARAIALRGADADDADADVA
jgi:hypothetical protein